MEQRLCVLDAFAAPKAFIKTVISLQAIEKRGVCHAPAAKSKKSGAHSTRR